MAKASVNWWKNVGDRSDKVPGLAKLLLERSIDNKETVFTATGKGVLESEELGLEEFLKEIQAKTNGTVVLSGTAFLGRGSATTLILWDEGALALDIGLDGLIGIELATTNKKHFVELEKVVEEHLLPPHVRQPVYALTLSNGVMDLAELGSTGQELDEGNYTSEVNSGYQYIIEDLRKDTPSGRLALIEGPPGTGKTFLLRAIIYEILDAVFILVPSDLVERLAGPEMVPMLLKARGLAGDKKPLILLIEDADRCLEKRKVGADERKIAALSALLNLTDGIMGQALDLRVVATTNLKPEEIDEALTRPGRLSFHLSVGLLPPEQAAEIFKSLTNRDYVFEGDHSLAQVHIQAFNDLADEEEQDEEEEEDEEELDEDDDEEEEEEDDSEFNLARVSREIQGGVRFLVTESDPSLY